MIEHDIALSSAAREMKGWRKKKEKEVIRIKVDTNKPDAPDPAEILAKLYEHRAYYEDYYNSLVENDADYFRQREAQAHLNGIEECVNLARRVIDGF